MGGYLVAVHVEGDIVIARPQAVVFDFVADQRNEPLYNPTMLRSELLTDGPIGMGSRFHAETTMRGRRVPMTIEITAFDRPARLASATAMSTMDITGTLAFTGVPGGTRMHWSWDLHPHGAVRALGPLVTLIGRRQENRIWSDLKAYLEAEPPPATAGG